MAKKFTREETIAKFRQVWGDQYDYSLITDDNYVNTSTHVPIVCRKHGMWMQTPHDHFSGAGCPDCWEERRGKSIRVTREEFIERANAIHGGKYNYDLVEFETTSDTIKIICPKHGIFEQCVANHLQGQGCKDCWEERRGSYLLGKPSNCRKIYCGVGVLDVDFSTNINDNVKIALRHWHNMIFRCYDKKALESHPSYLGCSVCEEWLLFSNFLEWFLKTENSTIEWYNLDKDILVKNNRVYSPQTCCFVPNEINVLLTRRRLHRGRFPIGVHKATKSKNFEASISMQTIGGKRNKHLGTFKTPEEAFNAYKVVKEAYIKEVATKYYNDGKIARNVYEALMNYKVEITD